ncbi:polysaccharide biosynthesis tyrosine autokinase [Curtobacterium herbarum]|uniref:non-specific protein-tyrosine kinase n=1 Tax=Curtobacterium herbarum TaxID=150122 RepID=A0ABP4KA12_9MICO|nr:polysaccharide biosynthesis tyrosine autokinase [Curtobacterium herbarum]MBM7476611.1 capsular exopolysaccharide synthesis family protein [Curtobacterium herbarum]MCS6543827.1 polysaccharide biosynthesis tyrosine autokinase [Curtobacterium herbarum]
MDLPDLLHSLRRRWPIAVAGLVLGTTAGCAALVLSTPTYDATARLYVTVASSETGSATDLVQGGNAAEQRVRSYVDIITTPRVLQPAIDELDLDTSAQDLARRVRAASPNDTVLLTLTVNDTSAKRAAATANAISASFTTLVADDLEQAGAGGTNPVSISTVQPALPPEDRASPQISRTLLLGIAGGAAVGVLGALLRDLLDTRIRGRAEVESVTDRPVLGTVPRSKDLERAPVFIQGNLRSAFAESFRALRTNLRFLGSTGTGRVFVITSANANEGKTTTAVNLAAALMEGGARVAIVDCDLRRPAVGARLDLDDHAGLTDVLIGRAELDDVLQPWGDTGRVLLSGPIPPNPADLLASTGMAEILAELAADNDYVIVDTPPLLPVTDAAILATSTAGAIVVTAAAKSRTNELRDALAILERANAHTLGIAISMVKTPSQQYGYSYHGDAPELTKDDLHPVRGVRVAD